MAKSFKFLIETNDKTKKKKKKKTLTNISSGKVETKFRQKLANTNDKLKKIKL